MNYLVFDVGGTNTKLAFFRDNKLIENKSFKTVKNNSLLRELISEILYFKKKYKINKFEGIAVSAPGSLEKEKFMMSAPTNIPGIRNLSLVPLKKFCKKFIFDNDGDCAAFGAFVLEKKKSKNLACITLGTGVGCGLILNGKLYYGNKVGSEFGHVTIDINGKKDNSGNYGTVESYISISGLRNIARKRGLNVSPPELSRLASSGNKKARSAYKEYSKYLATAIVNIANTLDLDTIYLTGGLVHGKRFFLNQTIKDAKSRFFKGINPRIKATSENLAFLGGLGLLRR